MATRGNSSGKSTGKSTGSTRSKSSNKSSASGRSASSSSSRSKKQQEESGGLMQYTRDTRDWVADHPAATAGLVAMGALAVGAAVWALNRYRGGSNASHEEDYNYSSGSAYSRRDSQTDSYLDVD